VLPIVVAWLASTIVSMVVAGAVLLALPADYLREGDLLVAVGVVLSVPGIPGQGILTIIAGLTLIEFPGRQRMIRALLGRPAVLNAVNRLRIRFKRKPFSP
jgi:hypothetical protein